MTPSSHDTQSQPTPCSLGLPSAPSPVHGELGHKGDIMGLGGRWLMGQESDMHTVHSELLLTELKADVSLIQLRQGPLQLRGRGEKDQGWGRTSPQTRLAPTRAETGRVAYGKGRRLPLTCSASGGGGLGHPKSSLRSRFPSYSRKVRWRLRKNSTCLFFTRSFFGEFQWITWDPGGAWEQDSFSLVPHRHYSAPHLHLP